MQTPKPLANIQDEFQQFNSKCVCQICTCGKHHCPLASTKFVGQTTYHHDFKSYDITAQKHEPCQYEVIQSHYDPESLKTSYQKDFPSYKIQPHLNPEKCQYLQKKMPFYDETEYKKSYVSFNVEVERPATTRNFDFRNKAKFQGATTYNAEFSPKHVEPVSHTPLEYPKKKIPFEGQTMYNSEFKPHEIELTKPTTYNFPQVPMRKNKFMGETRYHQDFKPYKIEKQFTCPVNVMPVMPRVCSPGKNHLNYSAKKHRWE